MHLYSPIDASIQFVHIYSLSDYSWHLIGIILGSQWEEGKEAIGQRIVDRSGIYVLNRFIGNNILKMQLATLFLNSPFNVSFVFNFLSGFVYDVFQRCILLVMLNVRKKYSLLYRFFFFLGMNIYGQLGSVHDQDFDTQI